MRAFATVRLIVRGADAGRVHLGHGALVGRLATAALQVDDPRVSEAHALVSLREGGLQLLALRRRFEVDGRPLSEVSLSPGLRVALAADVVIEVEQVRLPPAVLGLAWPGEAGAPLLHDAAWFRARPRPGLSWRADPGAPLQMWRVGEAWRYALAGVAPATLLPGTAIEVDGLAVRAIEVPLHRASEDHTRGADEPLRVVAFYDTVHVHRRGAPLFVIGGQGARLISELVTTGLPLPWREAASLLWSDEADDNALRNRLDAVVRRLRRKLAEGGLRDDLVAPDGTGHLELRLHEGDVVEDRT
jgi:hypothetical protein